MKAGWSCEVIWQEEEAHYLARLIRARAEQEDNGRPV